VIRFKILFCKSYHLFSARHFHLLKWYKSIFTVLPYSSMVSVLKISEERFYKERNKIALFDHKISRVQLYRKSEGFLENVHDIEGARIVFVCHERAVYCSYRFLVEGSFERRHVLRRTPFSSSAFSAFAGRSNMIFYHELRGNDYTLSCFPFDSVKKRVSWRKSRKEQLLSYIAFLTMNTR